MLSGSFEELLVILFIALLVFGPDQLPDLGRRLGRALREFRRASDEVRATIETQLQLHEDPVRPPPTSGNPEAGTSGSVAHAPSSREAGPLVSCPAVSVEPVEPAGTLASPPLAQAADAPLGGYWARRGGRLLHRPGCGWRARVPEAERIPLNAIRDGHDLDLLPCPVCNPTD